MPTLATIVDLLHSWYPPESAEPWDAVGLVSGDPASEVRRIMFAVDPTLEVALEAARWDADLLVCHHPLFLQPVHSVARLTPKARTLGILDDAGCALLAAHTNADRARFGVSESLALALGLQELAPLDPDQPGSETGIGRIGTVAETTLQGFADLVAQVLPRTSKGVLVGGDLGRRVRTVALCGGAGDSLLDLVARTDADVYLTSDLRHHLSSEFLQWNGPALVDVAHWAAEWTWLPVVRERMDGAIGDTVETYVSTIVTDPWISRLG